MITISVLYFLFHSNSFFFTFLIFFLLQPILLVVALGDFMDEFAIAYRFALAEVTQLRELAMAKASQL